MSAAVCGFVELADTCSTAEALRKYSGHKSWSTRYMNKVAKSVLFGPLERADVSDLSCGL